MATFLRDEINPFSKFGADLFVLDVFAIQDLEEDPIVDLMVHNERSHLVSLVLDE